MQIPLKKYDGEAVDWIGRIDVILKCFSQQHTSTNASNDIFGCGDACISKDNLDDVPSSHPLLAIN